MISKRKAEGHSRATHRPRIMKSGDSRTDSERDSGFSDTSSEHMSTMDITDLEHSPLPVVQKGPQTSQLAVVGGSYSNLSSMIIMNNILLKQQPRDNPPALKPWGFSPTVEVVQPVVQQPQVVFLQPMVSHQASRTSKEASSRHRHPKKYLPILKSYPKIAPHPGDSSSSSGRGTASSSSSTSSSSSESKRGSSLTSNHREHCQRKKQRSLCGGASNSNSATPSLPASPSIVSPLPQCQLSLHTAETSASSSPARERPSSAVSQAECTTSLLFTNTTGSINQTLPVLPTQENSSPGEHDHSDSDADTKRKRFCNTYNILSKSGLLDIALRTKELHRQNRRTQADLDQLKEHTDLFFQALWNGDSSIWAKLQASLQEEDREGESRSDQLKGRLDLD